MLKKVKLVNWLPAVFWALLIFFQSNNPSPPGADLAPDYVLHFFAYGILGTAILFGISGGLGPFRKTFFSRRQAALAAILSILYGFSDEWHQSFIPSRHSSWGDILADSLGAICFILFFLLLKVFKESRKLDS